MSNLAAEVRRRAAGLCEYCRIPESAFRVPFHIEHIVAKQHGGAAHLHNLALACQTCNLKKGPNLTGIDPETGEVTMLFNPRTDRWVDHFEFVLMRSHYSGVVIRGLTMVGRTTVQLLAMNKEGRQRLRYDLLREGVIRLN